jgi:hypothetical protein
MFSFTWYLCPSCSGSSDFVLRHVQRCLELTFCHIFRTGFVLACAVPMPSFIPTFHVEFSRFLIYDFNVTTIGSFLYFLYYLVLDPVAAVRTAFRRISAHHLIASLLNHSWSTSHNSRWWFWHPWRSRTTNVTQLSKLSCYTLSLGSSNFSPTALLRKGLQRC